MQCGRGETYDVALRPMGDTGVVSNEIVFETQTVDVVRRGIDDFEPTGILIEAFRPVVVHASSEGNTVDNLDVSVGTLTVSVEQQSVHGRPRPTREEANASDGIETDPT